MPVNEPSVIGLSIRTRSRQKLYRDSGGFFKAEGRVEGRPNSNSKGVNPVAECWVVLYVVCPKSKCTDFLFKCLLDAPEITSYLLQNMTLGKLHSGPNVFFH